MYTKCPINPGFPPTHNEDGGATPIDHLDYNHYAYKSYFFLRFSKG